ncbi:MAG: hypothetical protein RJA70_3877 [Pseudomonadota bacterium]|jgi:CheY-like chemotaxis protein
MAAEARPRVVCVDDEPQVLAGLSLHLRRRYEVELAGSGPEALECLERSPGTAVVISDMRMPGMNGAEFLAKAGQAFPDTTRILLTGHAEIESAIAAVNLGGVFRFLVKPCPPPVLLAAVDAAANVHRLLIAERVLLEQTLHGSVKVLSEVLALTNPLAFGRATRVRQHASSLAEKLGLPERWQVEVAAMLSQLGAVVLASETTEKLYYGVALSAEEKELAAKIPDITGKLLTHIPRLEGVCEILASYSKPYRQQDTNLDAGKAALALAAQILKVALDLDACEAQGGSRSVALGTLRGRADRYAPQVLEAASALYGGEAPRNTIHEIGLTGLKPGMVFAADVKMVTGTLLVPRGYEVTESFLARMQNFRPGSVQEPVRILLSATVGS